MSTMTQEHASVKPARLTIKGTAYSAEPIDAGEDGTEAFRLTKHSPDGKVYDVVRGRDGLIRCDCGDATFRREGLTAEPCKHGRALVALGLLDAPAAPLPPPRRPGVDYVADEFDAPTEAEKAEGGRALAAITARALADARAEAEEARAARESAKVEPPTAPATADVDAYDWARSICGGLWSVATPEQRSFAVELLNRDYLVGSRITPPGPTLAELRAKLDAPAPETPAPAPSPAASPEPAPAPLSRAERFEVNGVVNAAWNRLFGALSDDEWASGSENARIEAELKRVEAEATAAVLARRAAPAACCPGDEPRPCQACLTADDAPAAEALDLAGFIDDRARACERLDTAAADLLAGHIRALAAEVRAASYPGESITPAEFALRREAMAV